MTIESKGLVVQDGRYYWKGRPLDLKIAWRGADTEIESAAYDDDAGGDVSPEDWDAINHALVHGAIGRHVAGKHTPGPWHVAGWKGRVTGANDHAGNAHAGNAHAAVWSDADTLIAPVGAAGDAESDANARLIAAAPEMLAALKELEDNARMASEWMPHVLLIEAVKKAQAAIAKAEGR